MNQRFFVPILAMLLSETLLAQVSVKNRCSVDSLDVPKALGRNQYVKACFENVIWKHGTVLNAGTKPASYEDAWQLVHEFLEMNGTRPHPYPSHYTPVFLKEPEADIPMSWAAPTTAPAAEDLASDASKAAYCSKPENTPPVDPVRGKIGFDYGYRCRASCFAPEVRVFFKDSYIAMKKAFETQPSQVTVLAQGATFDKMSYHLQDIEHWTVSIRSEPHVLKTFATASGARLRVTLNHPLVTSDGLFREAKDLNAGDYLVKADGTPDMIVEAENADYFGKVYNLKPKGDTAKGNIVVSEGVLSGSDFIQNEGHEFVSERGFRSELPLELVN